MQGDLSQTRGKTTHDAGRASCHRTAQHPNHAAAIRTRAASHETVPRDHRSVVPCPTRQSCDADHTPQCNHHYLVPPPPLMVRCLTLSGMPFFCAKASASKVRPAVHGFPADCLPKLLTMCVFIFIYYFIHFFSSWFSAID